MSRKRKMQVRESDRWESIEDIDPEERHNRMVSRMILDAGGLSPRHKLFLLVLNSSRQERFIAPVETLAAWSKMSPQLTERIVNDLDDLKVLEVWRAADGRQRRPHPTAYRIKLDRLAEIRRRDV